MNAYTARDLELLSTPRLQQLLQEQGVCTDSKFLQGAQMKKNLLYFATTLAAIKPQGAGRSGRGGGGGSNTQGLVCVKSRPSVLFGDELRQSALDGPHISQPRADNQLLPCSHRRPSDALGAPQNARLGFFPNTLSSQPKRLVFSTAPHTYAPIHAPHNHPRPPTSRCRPSTARPAQSRVFITGEGARMDFEGVGGGGPRPVTARSRMESAARSHSASRMEYAKSIPFKGSAVVGVGAEAEANTNEGNVTNQKANPCDWQEYLFAVGKGGEGRRFGSNS